MANAWIKGNLQVTQNESSITIKVTGGKNIVKLGSRGALELGYWLVNMAKEQKWDNFE